LPAAAPRLIELLDPARIIDLEVETKEEALRRLSQLFQGDPRVLDAEVFHQAILRREQLVSTGVGSGIAIPHVKIPQVTDYVAAVGRLRRGIDFAALDNQPVHLIFMIGASDRQTREFVRILAQVTHLLKDPATRQKLLDAEIPDGFLQIIQQHER